MLNKKMASLWMLTKEMTAASFSTHKGEVIVHP
jgi:hypothetical protein